MKTNARFILLCILLTAILTLTLLRWKRQLEAIENGNSKAALLNSSRQNVVQTEKSATYNASNVDANDNKGTTVHDKEAWIPSSAEAVRTSAVYDLENYTENILTPQTRQMLANLLGCHDKKFEQQTRQRGEFWTLQNYVMAEHGPVACHERITYTSHADYTFLDNLLPLVSIWLAPVSIALYTPGTDLEPTIESMRYVRDCLDTPVIKQFVTFHIYFPSKHIPKQIPNSADFLKKPYNCSHPPPYESNHTLYKTDKKLLYPLNIGRNLAREAALTHFILPSDVELYPSSNLVPKFLNMIARNKMPLNKTEPRVFPLTLFEVDLKAKIPQNKTELLEMMKNKTAIPFHQKVCSACHTTPKQKEWLQAKETKWEITRQDELLDRWKNLKFRISFFYFLKVRYKEAAINIQLKT